MKKVKKQMKGGVIYKSNLFSFCQTKQKIINQFINQMEVSMRKVNMCLLALLLIVAVQSVALGQEAIVRKELDVPKVDPSVITIDGVMDEAAWENAAEANLVTSTGFEIWYNSYGREMAEPDYDEFYARMLWSEDTLYLFLHMDEYVNDSTGIWFGEQWTGDQLFVGLSNRLGMDMMGWYDGNIYAAPDGPYHFLILGDYISLNHDPDTTWIPEEFRHAYNDSLGTFKASDIAVWATAIDSAEGIYDLEMAIYNPNITAQSSIGFNIGGSNGHSAAYEASGDAYAYFCWQPNIPDDPMAPAGEEDPGAHVLKTSKHWAILNFTPGPDDVTVRKELDVPKVDPSVITIDGVMDEAAWENAAEANLVTSTGFEIWYNSYGREMAEPDYDEFYARMLWSEDTLYLFLHMDEYVNDSTGIWFGEQWTGDQLFVGLSNRLGMDMMGWYDGNIYAAPDGPYHFLILGDYISLNHDPDTTWIPEEFRHAYNDSLGTFKASDIAVWATAIDSAEGIYDLEMAIYNPNITAQSSIGFNIGGSNGHSAAYEASGDAYAYFCWQPNIPDDPMAPAGEEDPGAHVLKTSKHWAILNFTSGSTTDHIAIESGNKLDKFVLSQNYPNPFNPTTTIRFEITERVPVTLKIYNVLGKEVATLIDNRAYAPGVYSVIWDGSSLSSGIYFYQLITDKVVSTRKMILMK